MSGYLTGPSGLPAVFVIGSIAVLVAANRIITKRRRARAGTLVPRLLGLGAWVRGDHLHRLLGEAGIPFPAKAFYDFMMSLERDGTVWHKTTLTVVDGTTLRERWFRLPMLPECARSPLDQELNRRAILLRYFNLFARTLPELRRTCPGEYAAIAEDQVMEHAADPEELVRIMVLRFPESVIFMERVPLPGEPDPKLPDIPQEMSVRPAITHAT